MALFLPRSPKASLKAWARTGTSLATLAVDSGGAEHLARPARRTVVLLGSLAGPLIHPAQGAPRPSPVPAPARHPAADLAEAPRVPRLASQERAVVSPGTVRNQLSCSIAVASRVVELVDDTCSAVLLSQLIYWTRRGRDVVERDGWIHKSAREWELETGLSWKMQRRARKILLDIGLLEERLQAMPASLAFRLNLRAFVPLMAERSEIEMPAIDLSWFVDRDSPILGRLLGRSFLFHTALTAHMSVPAAMMASRLLSAQGDLRGRPARLKYVQLSREAWRRETGLTRHQWQTARRDLKALGLLLERRHNFPRRVDLSIDPVATAPLLASAMAAPIAAPMAAPNAVPIAPGLGDPGPQAEAGSVWAKQTAGSAHPPKRPAASTEPADRRRPNQPIAIDHSGLYSQDSLQVQPQPPLQPQPRPSARGGSVDRSTPQWSGGGWPADCSDQAGNGGGSTSCGDEGVLVEPGLVWPAPFGAQEGDREAAARHLAGLDRGMQQTILDEVAWRASQGTVRSPVGLLRTLCRKAAAGEFAADGAHRIASARRQRDQAPLAAAVSPEAATSYAPSAEVRAKFDALRQEVKRRRWSA